MNALPPLKSLFLVLVAALTLQTSAAEWQTIDFNGLFTFRLPSGFVRNSSVRPDDVRVEYHKDQTKLVVLWGDTESIAYRNRQQHSMHDYHESTTRIGGRRANIRTYWQTIKTKRVYRAELNLGNWERGEVELYMRVESNDAAILEIADQIFKSITLPLPSPERPSRPFLGKPATHIKPSRATAAGIS